MAWRRERFGSRRYVTNWYGLIAGFVIFIFLWINYVSVPDDGSDIPIDTDTGLPQHDITPVVVPAPDPTANTLNGTFIGGHNETWNQDYFLGLPYAQPPVGNLRFRPALSLNESFETRDAKEYGASCMQGKVSCPRFRF